VALLLILLGFGLEALKIRSKGFLQFNKGWFATKVLIVNKPLEINLWVRNLGEMPVTNVYDYFEVRLVRPGPEPDADRQIHSEMFKNALHKFEQDISSGIKGKSIGAGHGEWLTLRISDSLTQDEYTGIMQGSIRIYIYAWARWRDAENDLDFCNWMQAPAVPEDIEHPIWHLCVE